MQKAQLKQIIKQVLREEFVEHTVNSAVPSKKYSWMKDVPLVYPELNMGSDPHDPEDDILLKNYTYLEGPEDVAEVLFDLITEADTVDTGYDFQTIKADYDAYYDFLNTTFDKLVYKYDEELLSAFEDRAIKVAISEYIHESSEDNMASMRRQIRAEIAQLEAEKAADTDPTSAYYYDEKIKACWAELRELGIIAPTKATAKKRAIAAEKEEKTKEIQRRLKYAFMGLSSYFGRPKCIPQKNGGWLIRFKQLSQAACNEAISICTKVGVPVKYIEDSSNGSVFEVDNENLTIAEPAAFDTLRDIDYEAIKARLKVEQDKSKDSCCDLVENNRQINLKESHSTLVEEFKLYENMWN